MALAYGAEKGKILQLDSRRRIYEVVVAYAGSHFREIERKSALPNGSAKYHLSYLSRHGIIREERDGRNVRYFPTEFKIEDNKLLSLLRQKKIREIILFVLTHPGCNHEHIVGAVGVSPSTVSWHLKKLEESAIINSKKQGRRTSYTLLTPEQDIVRLLITYRESFLDSLVDRVIEMWE